MSVDTPSQDCPDCGRFVQDRPNVGLRCECGWKKTRHPTGKFARETKPFPTDRDPDEFHQHHRNRLFAHHGGPTIPLFAGAYGLEQGDRITWRREVWTVNSIVRWPDNRGHSLELEAPDGTVERFGVRWTFMSSKHRGERVEVLTSSHYSACGDCGEPWPCREVQEGARARRAVDALLTSIEHEAKFPVVCPADPACGQRFRTARGAAQHVARARRHRPNHPTIGGVG